MDPPLFQPPCSVEIKHTTSLPKLNVRAIVSVRKNIEMLLPTGPLVFAVESIHSPILHLSIQLSL